MSFHPRYSEIIQDGVQGDTTLQIGARTGSSSLTSAESSVWFNQHCSYLTVASSLSTPFSDCSKPHHWPQVPCVFPASLPLKWSHRKLFHEQNKWASLDCIILCLLHQQTSYTHNLAFSLQYPRWCSSFCPRHILPYYALSYPFPSIVLQLLMVQTPPLYWILSPWLRNVNKCL